MRKPSTADMRPVECEPANWAKDNMSFIPFNESGGYIWCELHFCWHWIDAPREKAVSASSEQTAHK